MLFGDWIRPDAVAALDLLGPGDGLTREATRARLATEQLRAQPGGAPVVVAEVKDVSQRRRLGRKLRCRNKSL